MIKFYVTMIFVSIWSAAFLADLNVGSPFVIAAALSGGVFMFLAIIKWSNN